MNELKAHINTRFKKEPKETLSLPSIQVINAMGENLGLDGYGKHKLDAGYVVFEIRCSDLINNLVRGHVSACDPIVLLYQQRQPQGPLKRQDSTDVLKKDKNPVFQKRVIAPFSYKKPTKMRFEVRHCDGEDPTELLGILEIDTDSLCTRIARTKDKWDFARRKDEDPDYDSDRDSSDDEALPDDNVFAVGPDGNVVFRCPLKPPQDDRRLHRELAKAGSMIELECKMIATRPKMASLYMFNDRRAA